MKTRRAVLVTVAALLLGSPAAAQRPGSVEVGAYGGYANYDNSLPLGNPFGTFGGRIGVHVLPVLSLEADVARASNNDVTSSPLHVWLVYNVPPVSRAEIFVGAGYVRNSYSGVYEADDSGVAGLVGFRHRVTDMVAIRVDGRADFIPSPANDTHLSSFNGNWGINVGVSVLLNRPPATR